MNQRTTVKQTEMGATVHDQGVCFRVWAPHADSVSVVGTFNDWSTDASPMQSIDAGQWVAEISNAKAGDQYKFFITNGEKNFERIDPYAREVTNSIGNGVVTEPNAYDWIDDHFAMPTLNQLVIYELHVGTFHRTGSDEVGTFDDVVKKLGYLKWLGINAIEIMPVAEFAGDVSWGYNPAHIFAVESAYGGPDAIRRLVKAAHDHGIAVIMDVVYNHFGPGDLDLWQFDGWSENDKGGIYFYNDWRSETPWGDSRPDYGRGEVRKFIHDNAMMWLTEYNMDGLRYDMTLYMRSVDGSPDREIPEGWSLAQWINREIHQRFPEKITIAEDLRSNAAITESEAFGGANFSTQWDEAFVHPVRGVIQAAADDHRDMDTIKSAIEHRYNDDAFNRVVYTESHDEVANGKKRVVSEIDENAPNGFFARRRSTLGAVLVFTTPGIPMIFQGQEFLRPEWFDDTNPIDWDKAGEEDETMRLYRDLIRLRLNHEGNCAGLTGEDIDVFHVNNLDKVIAFRRALADDSDSEVIVLMNFSNRCFDDYRIGFPTAGRWNVRFDSGSSCYAEDGHTSGVAYVETVFTPYDWYGQSSSLALAAYSAVIFSK
jgi:1,4-alpha-glucan branching enzyme